MILELTAVAAVVGIAVLYGAKKKGVFDDEFMAVARQEQKTVSYPGCARGVLKCYDFCSTSACPFDTIPTEAWVRKRAAVLRKRATCQHVNVRPKFDRMFPEIGRRGEVCDNCDLMRRSPEEPWIERND
jgi:hypothetical protein